MEDRIKRDKAFIGAIIKGVGGALVKGIINARRAKKEAQQQREIANRQIINQNNANINAEMQNTDYINDYDDRIEFNNGGKVNMKKKGNDRVALAKKCKCGGRKRASIGSEIKINTSANVGNGNYMDRLNQAKMGTRKCAKCGGKKC